MSPQALVRDALEVITFPAAAASVLQQLDDPDAQPASIAGSLALDPPLASRVLRIANSPFFLGRAPVDELRRAVMVLGTALLRDLVLGAAAVRAFQSTDVSAEMLEDYWKRSTCCGSIAAEIASISNRRLAEVAFTAGLMHDLGELLLHIRHPAQMREIRDTVTGVHDGELLRAAEQQVFGFDHTAVGAALADAWHFPETLAECMAFHHSPLESSPDYLPLVAIVHIASGCAARMSADDGEPSGNPVAGIEPRAWAHAGIDAASVPALIAGARERIDAMQAALL